MESRKVSIITSKVDPASTNMRENLLKMVVWSAEGTYKGNLVQTLTDTPAVSLYTVEKHTIYCDGIDLDVEGDILIFVSTHTSKSRIPSFTCHMPGNWGKAELGGRDRTLTRSSPPVLKHALRIMLNSFDKDLFPDHDVVQEVTHHGPAVDKPCLFIEIGSDDSQWSVPANGEFQAKNILQLARDIAAGNVPDTIPAVGIGGTHTASNFFDIMKDGKYGVGHICPKYSMQDLDEAMLRQALEKNDVPCSTIIVDWKGLGGEKARVKEILLRLEGEGITWIKTSDAKPRKEKN